MQTSIPSSEQAPGWGILSNPTGQKERNKERQTERDINPSSHWKLRLSCPVGSSDGVSTKQHITSLQTWRLSPGWTSLPVEEDWEGSGEQRQHPNHLQGLRTHGSDSATQPWKICSGCCATDSLSTAASSPWWRRWYQGSPCSPRGAAVGTFESSLKAVGRWTPPAPWSREALGLHWLKMVTWAAFPSWVICSFQCCYPDRPQVRSYFVANLSLFFHACMFETLFCLVLLLEIAPPLPYM